jgi:hypothetical protein
MCAGEESMMSSIERLPVAVIGTRIKAPAGGEESDGGCCG